MANKQNKQIIIGSLILIIILALVYFPSDAPLSVAYSYQCSLPSCQSGYSLQEKYCEGKTCYGVCEKPLPSYCGNYGYTKSISKNIVFDKDDNNKYFSTSQIFESSNKCYRFRAGGQIRITNRDPGGFLRADSESHKIIFGGAGMESSICSTQNEFWKWTGWNEVGHGTSGTGRGAYGKYISYKDTSCGSQSYGSEGSLLLTIEYQEAPWIDNLVDTKTTSCSFECNTDPDCGSTGFVGSKTCSGGNVVQNYESNSCQSYNCQSSQEEKIVDFCDFGCESGSCVQRKQITVYTLSGDDCNKRIIYEDEQKYQDYDTLEECQLLIEEESILIYRLENNNCNSIYLKISEQLDTDFNTLSDCNLNKIQKKVFYRFQNNKCSPILIFETEKTSEDYFTIEECETGVELERTFYRLKDNKCLLISILPSEKESNDYSTPEECTQNIDKPIKSLTGLIIGGIVVFLSIVLLVVWIVKRTPRRKRRRFMR